MFFLSLPMESYLSLLRMVLLWLLKKNLKMWATLVTLRSKVLWQRRKDFFLARVAFCSVVWSKNQTKCQENPYGSFIAWWAFTPWCPEGNLFEQEIWNASQTRNAFSQLNVKSKNGFLSSYSQSSNIGKIVFSRSLSRKQRAQL